MPVGDTFNVITNGKEMMSPPRSGCRTLNAIIAYIQRSAKSACSLDLINHPPHDLKHEPEERSTEIRPFSRAGLMGLSLFVLCVASRVSGAVGWALRPAAPLARTLRYFVTSLWRVRCNMADVEQCDGAMFGTG
jgi:hypothetical protein